MQRLWIILGSLLTVPVVGLASLNVVSLLAHEEETEIATFDADGLDLLDLDNSNGSVEIVGSDRDDVRLEAHISHDIRRTRHSAEVRGDTLEVRSHCPLFPVSTWCSVDHRLAVPDDLTVRVSNGNGSVTVRDLESAVTVDTSNGRLDLAGIGGTLEAHSSNGSVEARSLTSDVVDARTSNGSVELAFVGTPTTVDTHTSNGSIEVVVPDDGDPYAVDVESRFTGSTDTSVRTDPTTERSIAASTSNGSVTVRYPTG